MYSGGTSGLVRNTGGKGGVHQREQGKVFFCAYQHRQGIGKELFGQAKAAALALGYSFIQVKTVQMGRYEDYDRTNLFYLSLGFQEFEVFPTLWDEWNPCQVYVMAL